MVVKTLIKPGFYQDSVALMRLSREVSTYPGVIKASVMMGTTPNKDVLKESSLYNDDVEAAEPGDMIVAISAEDDDTAQKAIAFAQEQLSGSGAGATKQENKDDNKINSITAALEELDDANIALISVPGVYAASEALKALKNGLNVFLFSDNVSIEDEVELKNFAHERGLIVMGPDCGTSYIGGIPLGFANIVRQGNIGLVGASGTGLQEVMCLVDRWGCGVSHAIGTGSRDLSEEVKGITMLDALGILAEDETTEVVVLVSKPPAPQVASKIMDMAAGISKPVVVCFLGASFESNEGVYTVYTLEDAAREAVRLVNNDHGNVFPLEDVQVNASGNQSFLRGLYSGGSIAEESLLFAISKLGRVYSNLKGGLELDEPNNSREHTIVDMGSDEFTMGKPHPMIDFTVRIDRFKQEAEDPETGVILMDIVLGYGSQLDPAGVFAPIMAQAKEQAKLEGRELNIVLNIVGTEADPQQYSVQAAKFREVGAFIAPTNMSAARLAVKLTGHRIGKGC